MTRARVCSAPFGFVKHSQLRLEETLVRKPHRIYLTAPANRETDSQTDRSTDGARARGGGVFESWARRNPVRLVRRNFQRNPRAPSEIFLAFARNFGSEFGPSGSCAPITTDERRHVTQPSARICRALPSGPTGLDFGWRCRHKVPGLAPGSNPGYIPGPYDRVLRRSSSRVGNYRPAAKIGVGGACETKFTYWGGSIRKRWPSLAVP